MGAWNEVCVPAQALGGVGNAWIKPGCTAIRLRRGSAGGKPLMAQPQQARDRCAIDPLRSPVLNIPAL